MLLERAYRNFREPPSKWQMSNGQMEQRSEASPAVYGPGLYEIEAGSSSIRILLG